MRGLMERLVVLPFSVGCVSEASVAVCLQQPTSSKQSNTNSNQIGNQQRGEEEEEEEEEEESLSEKNSYRILTFAKPNITSGCQRLVKSFKTFSELFAYKEDMEMEIGLPTDVKHVTHIGVYGSQITNPVTLCQNLSASDFQAPNFHSAPPSLTLSEFELAMVAGGAHDNIL